MVIELAFKFTRQDEVAIEEFRKHQGWGNIIKTSQWPTGKKEISWRLVPWNPSVDKYSWKAVQVGIRQERETVLFFSRNSSLMGVKISKKRIRLHGQDSERGNKSSKIVGAGKQWDERWPSTPERETSHTGKKLKSIQAMKKTRIRLLCTTEFQKCSGIIANRCCEKMAGLCRKWVMN